METRRFGSSDLSCSALGFGTWELSTTQYGKIDVDEARRAVWAALDRGITLFDTAEVYGPFHSEQILGKALGTRRKEVVLVTKVGFDYDGQRVVGKKSSFDHIVSRSEDCLRRLETDWIDLMLIHWPDHNTPYDEPIRALETLKTTGKIRHYGVSNFSPAMMTACAEAGSLTANQVGYNLFDRRVEKAVLPYCQSEGVGFMAYGTLAYGLLTGAFSSETTFLDWDWRSGGKAFGLPIFQEEQFLRELRVVDRLKELAGRHDKSVAQLAIAWVVGHSPVTVALVGVRNVRELEENVAAVDWRLTPQELEEIDRFFEEEDVPTHVSSPQAV